MGGEPLLFGSPDREARQQLGVIARVTVTSTCHRNFVTSSRPAPAGRDIAHICHPQRMCAPAGCWAACYAAEYRGGRDGASRPLFCDNRHKALHQLLWVIECVTVNAIANSMTIYCMMFPAKPLSASQFLNNHSTVS